MDHHNNNTNNNNKKQFAEDLGDLDSTFVPGER
jgi:hypothetical protein